MTRDQALAYIGLSDKVRLYRELGMEEEADAAARELLKIPMGVPTRASQPDLSTDQDGAP